MNLPNGYNIKFSIVFDASNNNILNIYNIMTLGSITNNYIFSLFILVITHLDCVILQILSWFFYKKKIQWYQSSPKYENRIIQEYDLIVVNKFIKKEKTFMYLKSLSTNQWSFTILQSIPIENDFYF